MERDIELVRVSGVGDGSERLRLVVAAESGGDFARPSVVATLELEGTAGGRERRVVEAADCSDLQRAIAVILATFAQQVRPLPTASVDEQAPVTAPSRPEAAARVEAELAVEPLPERSTKPQRIVLASRIQPRIAAKPRFEDGELRFGTTLNTGYGWVDAAMIGPALYLEWRPSQRSLVSVRAAASYLTTLELRQDNTALKLERWYGMLGAKLATPLPLLSVLGGAEFGSVSAAAAELLGNHEDYTTWLSFLLMPELELPLYERILFAQLGTGLLVAPVRYQFRYRDTEHLLANTRHFEWRAEVGLAVQLTPTLP